MLVAQPQPNPDQENPGRRAGRILPQEGGEENSPSLLFQAWLGGSEGRWLMMPVYARVGEGDEREGQGLGVQCEHPMSTCHLVFAPGLLSLPCLLGLLSPLVTLGLAH